MGGVESSEKPRPLRQAINPEKPRHTLRQAVNSEKPRLTLRLLVNKKRNKVVLAEACKDFVDVLFSLLTLPMGTIVRLVEQHRQSQMSESGVIGSLKSFNNLYNSVLEMDISNFSTEACKQMLLRPRSLKEKKCRRLKINIDDTDVLKYYMCPNAGDKLRCSKVYSNFCSSRCSCGELMRTECVLAQSSEDDHDEIFVSSNTSFIISDDMKVRFNSVGVTMRTLRELGYAYVDNLEEMVVNVNTEEVLALLECLFSSDTPLTDVFLRKQSVSVITRQPNMPSVAAQSFTVGTSESNEVLSLSLFVRKQDNKVLYAESNEDFVDLLFTFLAVPLEYVWELCGTRFMLGCIGNLYQSFQSLSFTKRAHVHTSKSMLPWYYVCQRPLLDVCYTNCSKQFKLRKGSQCYLLSAMDPKSDCIEPTVPPNSGFLKRGTTFLISNDLDIIAASSSSTVRLLKKLDTDLDDIEEQVISISEAEAISLLKASLVTCTPLTTALSLGRFTSKEAESGENLRL